MLTDPINSDQYAEILEEDSWRLMPSRHAAHVSDGRWERYPWITRVLETIRPQILAGGARIIVNGPPRHGKSQAITYRLPSWYLDMFPDNRVIVGSYGATLATDWGRKVRDYFQNNPNAITKVNQQKRAADNWETVGEGGMVSVGVGKGVTGKGGDLVIVDDPHKDWEEALSPTFRKRVINWFDSTLYTRLEPNASIVIIQCMTGDTPVLMASGREKCLRDIVVGDEVATYKDGQLESSRINNWINHGPDLVFTIRMTSGAVVKANARQPFLRNNKGVPGWRRLKDLKLGDQIVGFQRGHGKELLAELRGATGKLKRSYSPPLDTYEIILDTVAEIVESGYEDVFDIEVDHTENFIANGLVSHNTRWHESDLTGYLLREHKDNWQHIRLPAIAEEDDWLGRAVGEPLCPERYPLAALERIKASMPSLMWAGLYQQRPAPLEGNIIKRDWFNRYTENPLEMEFDELIQSWDPTFKETGTSFCTGQVWGRKGPDFFACDQFRDRVSFLETEKAIERMTAQWPGAQIKLIEEAANGHALISTLKTKMSGIVPVPPKGSKTIRLISVSGLYESGNVWVPADAPWAEDFIEEHVIFPNGPDDQVDCASQALTRLSKKAAVTSFVLPSAGARTSPWSFENG